MHWQQIVGGRSELAGVVVKALLLYLTAVVGFRVPHRRTLAELTGFDVVAAVAVGAIVGRVPNSNTTSYLAGFATLVTVLAAHAVLTRRRRRPVLARLLDHAPRLLVQDGQILDDAVRACGLTVGDLHAQLRQKGVYDLDSVRYVIVEQRATVSIVRRSDSESGGSAMLDKVLSKTGPGSGSERFAEGGTT